VIIPKAPGLGCVNTGCDGSCGQGLSAYTLGQPQDFISGAQLWLTPTQVPTAIGPAFASGNILGIVGLLAVPALLYYLLKGHMRLT